LRLSFAFELSYSNCKFINSILVQFLPKRCAVVKHFSLNLYYTSLSTRLILVKSEIQAKGKTIMNISAKRLQEINSIPDESINISDIPELDGNFWEKAKLVEPITKKAISLQVDSDVLEWFKNQGKEYQSLMNSVLRSYVEHQLISSTSGLEGDSGQFKQT
jgi:uncharacterized protein (DUF4415 family)